MIASTIDDRQVTPMAGRLLRAYTSEYRRAKRYRGIRVSVGLMLAVTGPLVAALQLDVGALVAAVAGGWAIIGRLLLRPAEKRRVACAVRIQELFDTYVLDLPWSQGVAGTPPSEEDIAEAARRVEGDSRLATAFAEGWYPPTGALPRPVDVLVAQLSSVAWGRRQHRRYAGVVAATTVILVVAAVAVGVLRQMLLAEWLIVFFLPAMPALLDVVDLSLAHIEMSERKQGIEELLSQLWGKALDVAASVTLDDCRSVQDEVLKLRSVGLQIPQWFYKMNRAKDETTMRQAATARCQQYQAANLAADANESETDRQAGGAVNARGRPSRDEQ